MSHKGGLRVGEGEGERLPWVLVTHRGTTPATSGHVTPVPALPQRLATSEALGSFGPLASADSTCSSNVCAIHSEAANQMGGLPRTGRDQKTSVRHSMK